MTDYPDSMPQSSELVVMWQDFPQMPVEVAMAILQVVINHCGSDYLKMEARNLQMIAEFDGKNIRQLCTRYRITPNTFYRILRHDRKRRRIAASKRLKKIS